MTMRDRTLYVTAFCAACAGTLLTLGIVKGFPETAAAASPVPPEPEPAAVSLSGAAAELQEEFAGAVEKVMPGVVLIT